MVEKGGKGFPPKPTATTAVVPSARPSRSATSRKRRLVSVKALATACAIVECRSDCTALRVNILHTKHVVMRGSLPHCHFMGTVQSNETLAYVWDGVHMLFREGGAM